MLLNLPNFYFDHPLPHLDVKEGDPIHTSELAQQIRTIEQLGFSVVVTLSEPDRGRATLHFHALPGEIEISDA